MKSLFGTGMRAIHFWCNACCIPSKVAVGYDLEAMFHVSGTKLRGSGSVGHYLFY